MFDSDYFERDAYFLCVAAVNKKAGESICKAITLPCTRGRPNGREREGAPNPSQMLPEDMAENLFMRLSPALYASEVRQKSDRRQLQTRSLLQRLPVSCRQMAFAHRAECD